VPGKGAQRTTRFFRTRKPITQPSKLGERYGFTRICAAYLVPASRDDNVRKLTTVRLRRTQSKGMKAMAPASSAEENPASSSRKTRN